MPRPLSKDEGIRFNERLYEIQTMVDGLLTYEIGWFNNNDLRDATDSLSGLVNVWERIQEAEKK